MLILLTEWLNLLMNQLEESTIQCPYCGETLSVLIDTSIPEQQYIEDCQVCCRPINFDVHVGNTGELTIKVTNENE